MKIPILALGLTALVVNGLQAQRATQTQTTQGNVPEPTPYTIVKQDANSQDWERQEYEVSPSGQTITHLRHYKEICTGLNYLDANGNFQVSQDQIVLQSDGTAEANQAPHTVHFPIDLATGQIQLTTPDGEQIFSQPKELTYFDGTNAVVLGVLTNSVGVLVSTNQIIYRNAFSGIKASLRYTFTKAGFEQDVILLQQPLTPEYYSLNPDTARIQMVTEFFNPPTPALENVELPNQAGMYLTDQTVSLGIMRMGTGRAFLLGKSGSEPAALVAKSWLKLNGRQFLVEEVPVNAIVSGLAALPLTAMNGKPEKATRLLAGRIILPQPNLNKKSFGKIKTALSKEPEAGFVLDYQTINSSLTNVVFQCDTTYYVSGATYLYGTNTFEGGAVVKYAANSSIVCGSSVINWNTSAYRPVIFTAKDDNTVGDTISGSTGSPANYYGNPVLSFSGVSNPFSASNVRIKWGSLGAYIGLSQATLYNCQFVNCQRGLDLSQGTFCLRNTLFGNVLTNIYGGSATIDAENTTMAGSSCVASLTNSSMAFTNCIFANIGVLSSNSTSLTNNGDYNGFYNCAEFGSDTTTNPASPFQTVGDGYYYLTNGCMFHNAGTTNIDPGLLATLPSKTTYVPFVYSSGRLSLSNNLGIYAQRDNVGSPDLGYHYDPLDYVFGGSDLYSNVTFSAGTVIGYHAATGGVGSSGQPYGISLNSGASFNTVGTATSPCWIVDYDNVQEGTGSWADSGWMGSLMLNGSGSGSTPQINTTFTKWGRPWALFFRDNWDHGGASFVDCEFYGGSFATYDTSYLYYTNCLLDRPAIFGFDQDIAPAFTMQNCTFYDGFMTLLRLNSQPPVFWQIVNTSFDGTGFAFLDQFNATNSLTMINFNTYNTNNLSGLSYSYPYATPTNVLEVVGPSDQKISGYNWETSWFGGFYLPTNSPIIAMGSTNANLLGLYHFTTTTNQVVDGDSIVAIGYHYVATDQYGVPLDSNGDGMPDYLEDANGDGLVNNGETNWALAILGEPLGQTNWQGANLTLEVAADGVSPLRYQWYFNSSNLIANATNELLTLSNIQPTQAGSYAVVVTNQFGSINSSNAILGVNPTTINFSNFCAVSNIQLNGSADLTTTTNDGCVLELTPSAVDMAGSAFLKVPVALSWNASFSTFFSFRLSKSGGSTNGGSDGHNGADGIVFVLQTLTNNVGSTGGGIGYRGITSSVGIVFDTWWNDGSGTDPIDPTLAQSQNVLITTNANGTTGDGNHVGVVYNGYFTNAATFKYGITNYGHNAVAQHIMDDLNNSNIWYAWIDYNGASSNLQIRVSETNSRPLAPTLTNTVNLLDFLGQTNVYVGFTAGTGGDYNQQDILSWQINPNYNPIGATNQVDVAILSPVNQTFVARTNILITAVASNSTPNMPVNGVEFFAGTNRVGYAVSTNNLFQTSWAPIVGGNYVLTALGIDTNGESGWSAPVTNSVLSLPTVEMSSPVNGRVYGIFPTNLSLTATAAAYGSATITNVAYYQGTNRLGSSSGAAPYTVSWSVATNGVYVLHAVATDSLGHAGMSSNITITVEPPNEPPFVYAGPNMTNYLSTNGVSLNGLVSDDGLPYGGTLSVVWTNLNGGTNVTFVSSNLPDTSAYFWATGVYVLQLSASDSQYTTRSNFTVTVRPANHPPVITLLSGNSLTNVLPAANTNTFSLITEAAISANLPSPVGIDYFAKSNCVIASVNDNNDGNPFNFELVSTNGATNQFSTLSGLQSEVYIATARNSLGGFTSGEMFCGNGQPGQIMRIEPDGTTIGTNAWDTVDADNNPITNYTSWVILSNSVVGLEPGLLRGGLWVDRTGVWGGDLIVSTETGDFDAGVSTNTGDIWRVNSSGIATLVARIEGSDSFEGITTVPNDFQRFGPWAGKILVGGDGAGDFYAIDTNGYVVQYNFPFGAEDIRVVPQDENLYLSDVKHLVVYGVTADQFLNMAGDVLVGDESTGMIYRIHWDGSTFQVYQIVNLQADHATVDLEGMNFVPAGLLNIPDSGVRLSATVSDDGEIFATPSNQWTLVSGPGPVTIVDPTQPTTTAEFSTPGNYVLQLSSYDGQYTVTTNVTVHVLQNQPPFVSAGTNKVINTNVTMLEGVVTDDCLPFGQTNIYWSVISGNPSDVSFAASNQPVTSVTFANQPESYTLALTADDGQATNSAEVQVTVEGPSLSVTPVYGIATDTNTPFSITARLVDANNAPITNETVYFDVSGVNSTNGSAMTDSNGIAIFTYGFSNPDNQQSLQDNITIHGSSATPAYITKLWAPTIDCGGAELGQQLYQSGEKSREWPNYDAVYYAFQGTQGDTVHLNLVQAGGALILALRNPSDEMVATSPLNYEVDGSVTSLDYTPATNGEFIIEVAGPGSSFDLYLSCGSDTNTPAPDMEVLYHGTNVPNGGTVFFPPTSQGVATNLTLVITNAGNASFQMVGYGTNGDFELTNDVWSSEIRLTGGASTNFGLVFNATSSGVSLGALVLATNALGSNYVVYLEGNTFATDAVPAIELTSPPDGATYFLSQSIPFAAVVTPGGASVSASGVVAELLATNNLTTIGSLYESGYDVYTNWIYSGQSVPLAEGDDTITAVVTDSIGQTGTAPPRLIHVIPYLPPTPLTSPGMGIVYAGSNVPSGGTIVFPPTQPGWATNVVLAITNNGTYPLGLNWTEIVGDFNLPSQPPSSAIMPGTATNLVITFNASASGQSSGLLILSNNASQGGVYVLSLLGSANVGSYVTPATNPQPPVAVNDQFTVEANSANNILNPLANDTDSNGLALKIISVTAPGNGGTNLIVNNGTAISYSPSAGVRGYPGMPADGFSYTISDGQGGTATASVAILINAGNVPQVSLSASNSVVTAGRSDLLTATITNTPDVVKVDFYIGGLVVGEVTNSGGGVFVLNWTAAYDESAGSPAYVQATATDRYGQVGASPSVPITVTGPTNGTVVAALTSAVGFSGTNTLTTNSLTVIRDGVFNLYGLAYHSLGSNVVWELALYNPDGSLARNLTSGFNAVTSTATPLAKCDLTTVINGVYDLRLTVTGGYQTSETDVELDLESSLKLGRFSFSQQDLVIPVNGIPLKVVRTYDSLNPSKGDFGYGWTYTLENMAVSLDETRQDAVDVDGDTFSERSGGGWDVTLTLPNGQTTTFAFSFAPSSEYGTYQGQWTAAPGVTATLVTLDNATLYDFAGFTSLATPEWTSGESQNVPVDNFDFKSFMLETVDGTKYIINRDDLGDHYLEDGSYIHAYGQPYLSQIIQRDGDTISISPNAVVFQATNGASRQITFQRNADGLITSVSDPNAQTTNIPPTVQYQYDSQDNLIGVLNLVNDGTGAYVTNSFTYTNSAFPHYITGIINADGSQVAKNFYDDTGKLVAVQDANGNLTQFIQNETNSSEVIIDRLGYTNTYVYDARGNVIVQTNQLGQITTMAYDSNNNKTQQVDFLNGAPYATNNYVYDTNLNVMVSATDPLGHTQTYAYDAYSDLMSSVDALGHGTTNVYDGGGNLIATVDALGHGTTNVYSGSELVGTVDALGTVTTNYYDPVTSYLLTTATLDAQGKLLISNTFAYDADGNRTSSTVWRQVSGVWTAAQTAYVYDAMNRVVQTIDPNGGTNTVNYDPAGRQQATTDPLGNQTTYAYDAEGRLLQTGYADGTVTRTQYDANGNRIAGTDQAGRVTTYVYDALNRLVETVYPDGTTNTTVYDGVGRQAQTIDARGTVTAFAYDAAGRRLAVTNAVGTAVQTISSYSYDNDGNQITSMDALGHTTTNVFDVLNRQTATVYPDGTSMFSGYDAAGRRTAGTNQDAVVTWFDYDGSGRLICVTNAVGGAQQTVTRYQYDEAGNEIAQIDALGRTNIYSYDGLGRRVAHTLPGGQTETFGYDAAGSATNHMNFEGYVVSSQYDSMNRLTNITDVHGDSTFNYNYNYTLTGQRQSMIDPANDTTTYSYDTRDRLMQKVVSWGNYGLTASLNYQYDQGGNLTNLTSGFANGVQLSYAYDPLNRLTNVLSHGQPAASYHYDLVGNLQGMGYGNGVTNRYQYDPLNRLTNLVWQAGSASRASFAYTVKPGGTRTNLLEMVNGGSAVTYQWSYDNLYRLTNEVISGIGNAGYQYDAVGNRLARTTGGGIVLANQTANYDTNDDWTSDSSNTPAFDGDLNTSAFGTNSYSYDSRGWLTSGNAVTQITYDGDGNRVIKQLGATATFYLVDDRNPSGYAQVMEEYQLNGSSGGVLNRVYNWGLNLVSEELLDTNTLLPSTVAYYGYDGHGNVRCLMNTNGTVTDTYTYDAFGNLISSWYGGSAPTPNNYLYCGQQWDPDLGVYYNRARYLSTDAGRFLSRDTYDGDQEDPLSLHKYLYGADNPINIDDPSGHDGDIISLDTSISAGQTIEEVSNEATFRAFAWAALKATVASVVVGEAIETEEDKKRNIVFRRLSNAQANTPWSEIGIKAVDPNAYLSPTDHIDGNQENLAHSPWISTTYLLSVARTYGMEKKLTPIIEIDLTKVTSPYIDYTIPFNLITLTTAKARFLASADQEVLIEGYVPASAIVGEVGD